MTINWIVLGSCSICGGRVTVPQAYHSIITPIPTCESCGAVKADEPVIQMRPGPKVITTTGTGTREKGET